MGLTGPYEHQADRDNTLATSRRRAIALISTISMSVLLWLLVVCESDVRVGFGCLAAGVNGRLSGSLGREAGYGGDVLVVPVAVQDRGAVVQCGRGDDEVESAGRTVLALRRECRL